MDVKRIKGWVTLLQAAWQGYKKNTFILITALVPIILSVFIQTISLYINRLMLFSQEFFYAASGFILMLIITFLVGIYISAGMLGIVRDSIKKKSGISSLRVCWRTAKSKFTSLLGAYLITYAILFSIVFAGAISLIFNPFIFAKTPLLLIYLVLFAFAALLISFTSYAVVLADLKAVAGVRESAEFVKRNFFSVILLLLIVFAVIGLPLFLIIAIASMQNEMVVNFTVNLLIWLLTPYILFLFGYFYASRTKRKI